MVENDFLASELQKLDSLLGKLNLLQWTVQINLALLMQKVFSNNGAQVLKLKLSQKTNSALKFIANFGWHLHADQRGP